VLFAEDSSSTSDQQAIDTYNFRKPSHTVGKRAFQLPALIGLCITWMRMAFLWK